MAKIKVLYLLSGLVVGGAERATTDLASHIDKDRFDVIVCIYGTKIGSAIEKMLFDSGVAVRYLNRRYSKNPIINAIYYICSMMSVARIIKEFVPDVIDFRMSSMTYVFVIAAIFRRISFVYDIHNMPDKEITGRDTKLFTVCIKHLGVVPVVLSSRFVPEFSKTYHTDRCEVISNGIDLDIIAKPSDLSKESFGLAGNTIITCVARFSPAKNHLFLIRSFADILKRHPEAVLLLVGEGQLLEESKSLARDLNVNDSVKFMGKRDDVYNILSVSDIFVIPSLWEGVPISILEAMASGLPVIASSVGGNPDLVKNGLTGILFPNNDSKAFIEAVSLLITDSHLRREMSEKSKEAVKEHDIFKISAKFETLYLREVNKKLKRAG